MMTDELAAEDTLPTFICPGVYKCGTTWLQDMLAQHPEVYLPDFKEVHFFSDTHGERAWEELGIDWYRGLYRAARPGQQRGDISPGYMVDVRAAQRMAETVPRAKLIFALRDPAERAFAHYNYLHEGKHALPFTFDQLTRNPDLDPKGRWSILSHGFYAKNIAPFLAKYDRSRCHFALMDDLKRSPGAFLADVCTFLDIDPSFRPQGLEERSNPARALRSRRLYWLQYHVARQYEKHGLSWLRKSIKATGLPRLVRRLNTRVLERRRMTPEQRARLVELYRDDIRALEGIIGRSLEAWLR